MDWKVIGFAALAGAAVELRADFARFKAFKTYTEYRNYDWRLAGINAALGAVYGALTAVGINVAVS